MQVNVNTDRNIEGTEELYAYVRNKVENALRHVGRHITRVEVHLSDENSIKEGVNDKRCMMEARLVGLKPVAVSDSAMTLHQAIDGAGDKLASLIDSTLGKLRDK